MMRIFISYRRADSRIITNRIYDRLTAEFGKQNVFKDVDNIAPGSDFRGVIREATAQCQVMLVIIGPMWQEIRDANGNHRLDDPDDLVRLEVETDLQRDTVRVIPVLIENASPPKTENLPESLRGLAYKQAFRVDDDPRFHDDMTKLIKFLRPNGGRRRIHFDWKWLVGAVAIPIIAAVLTAIIPLIAGGSGVTPTPSQIINSNGMLTSVPADFRTSIASTLTITIASPLTSSNTLTPNQYVLNIKRSGDTVAVCANTTGNYSTLVIEFAPNESYMLGTLFPSSVASKAGDCWCLQQHAPIFPVPTVCNVRNTSIQQRTYDWRNPDITFKQGQTTLGFCPAQNEKTNIYQCAIEVTG